MSGRWSRPALANRRESGPIPFPQPVRGRTDAGAPFDEALRALEGVSRRIEDLARELHCLGYFDDDDGRPRAA